MNLMLGIDTGGTYTDAVVVTHEAGRVVAAAKAPTTHHDLAIGIEEALTAVLQEPGVTPEHIGLVSLSTTLATNALVEGHGDPACLITVGFGANEVARIMDTGSAPLGAAAGVGPHPFGDQRADFLVSINGGHDAMGLEREPLDLETLADALATLGNRVSAYAVSAQFSVRNSTHELSVREVVLATTAKPVTCGHELSARLDGLRRARTALLNARLVGVVGRLQHAVGVALAGAGIDAPVMMVRGDGSLASAGFAAKRPIETVLSGPAASVVGARHLVGTAAVDGLVVDIGGTTTDIATLRDGEPAIATEGAVVAGHRTMVEAVEVRTHGLGGDSEVRIESRPPSRSGASARSLVDIVRLGPSRAEPLCRLAAAVPDVCDQLGRQLADPNPVSGHGRLLMATGIRPAGELDDREQQVLDSLAEGPQPELEAASSSRLRLAAERLRRRRLILVATVTPTDAACLLGRLTSADNGNEEGARLGLALLARQRTEQGQPVAADAMELASRIEQLLIERSTDALLEAALHADGLVEPDDTTGASSREGMALSGLVASPIIRAALAGYRGATTLRIAVTDPLIAVGASAAAYYPRVATVLGTEVVVPPHAEVANAVGAAVGRVRVRRQLTVSRPRAGRYQLHVAEQPTHASIESARTHGERLLADEVLALAAEAGAVETADVSFEWLARTATVNGKEILVEGTITATATGRPRLG